MASILTVQNFVGKYELSITEETEIKLQLYIDRLEVSLLRELFGLNLYNLWNGSGLPLYTTLTAPLVFQEDACNGKIWESKGLVDMLIGFIYFEYSRDAYTQQTVDGAQKNSGENSGNSTFAMANLHGRYSDALTSYEAIQAYIKKESVSYPSFQGIEKHVLIPFF